MDVEAQFAERKSSYDKIAVGLEIEKQTLEKDCDTYQVTPIIYPPLLPFPLSLWFSKKTRDKILLHPQRKYCVVKSTF